MLKVIKRKLPSAVGIEIINRMISFAAQTPAGCFIEVGVYKGGTASHLTELASRQSREIYLYDTFEGIPFQEEIDIHKIGDFADTNYDLVRKSLPYAKVVKGIFPDSSLPMPPIAFAHLDVDQYFSYKTSINFIKNKIVKRGIIWIDDYSMKGCALAVEEELGLDNVKRIGNQAMIQLW